MLEKVFCQPQTRAFVVVNDVLTVLTLVSVAAIVLETVPSLSVYQPVFLAIEYVAVAVFTIEYISRFIVAERKTGYVFGFFGVVDLLSIIPTYLGLANLTFLKTARVLRIMRFLRMIRLTKVVRMRRRKIDIEDASDLYKLNMALYFSALFISILVLGTFIYLVEASHGTFTSIPAGMQWALETIVGGSISQAYPATTAGEMISILTRFTGMVLFGLLIAVVGSSVRRVIFGTENLTVAKKDHK